MVAVAKGDDFSGAGITSGGENGHLVGFGAAIGEEGFLEIAGGDRRDLFG